MAEAMRVLVCGSRDWQYPRIIQREMEKLPPDTVIIAGGARGADTMAAETAKELGLKLEIYMAEWQRYGRAAGPYRNHRMLVEGKPDLVMAFYNPTTSMGTAHMVRLARGAKVPVRVFFG